MNQNTNNVDVLAVLNRAEPIIANSDHGDAYAVLTMLPEARAAVAELVSAARDYADVEENAYDISQTIPARIRLRAALARVGGAK